MKVLLIRHHPNRSIDGNYNKVKNPYPPMGLVYLATYAMKENQDVEFQILDSYAESLTQLQTIEYIKCYNPNIVCVTALTYTYHGAIEIADLCKVHVPNAIRIVGGPHLLIDPEPLLKNDTFHLGVCGEGEITLCEIIYTFNKTRKIPKHISGTIYHSRNGLVVNKSRERIREIDKIPIPDRSLLKNEIYGPSLARKPFTYMITSRGCPFDCAYCYKIIWGKKYTKNSAERVVDEIKDCVHNHGVREIWIRDDLFTLNKRFVMDVCNMIVNEKLHFKWTVLARADIIDEETIIMLRKAGCYQISFGVENGNQKMLDFMKKRITLDQFRNTFALCRKHGIETFGFFMIGYPTETEKTIQETVRFACEIADWASFNPVSVKKGTELYDFAEEFGYIQKNYDKLNQLENYCNSDGLPTKRILQLTQQAYRTFYFRPKFIFNLALLILRNGNFLTYSKTLVYGIFRIFSSYKRIMK